MNNQPTYCGFIVGAFGLQSHQQQLPQQTQPATLSARSAPLPQRVSGRKRIATRRVHNDDDDDQDEDYEEEESKSQPEDDDGTEADDEAAYAEPVVPANNKRHKKNATAAAAAAASSSSAKKPKAAKKPKNPAAPRTPAQVAAALTKSEKKNTFPEVCHSTIIDRMPLALEAPLDAASSNGWMEALDLQELQGLSLPFDANNARVLVRVNVSRMLFDVNYQGTSGGRHYATQSIFIDGVEVGRIDRDFLSLSSFQDRSEQKKAQDAKRKGPARHRTNQADRQPAEIVLCEFPRVTIVSAAPNAFNEGTRTKFPSQNVAVFGSTQVSQQAVGKGKPVATYVCLYVDRADANKTITIGRARSLCGEHRLCYAHDACQLKIGYAVADVMRSLNAQGEWVEHPAVEYGLPVIAKPTKLTTDSNTTHGAIAAAAVAAAAAAAAAIEVPQAAASTSAAAAPRAPRPKYTTASKKAAAKASRLAVWAAAHAANAAATEALNAAAAAFVPAPQALPPAPIGPGFISGGALPVPEVARSTSPCSPQSIYDLSPSGGLSPKLLHHHDSQSFSTTFVGSTTDLPNLNDRSLSPGSLSPSADLHLRDSSLTMTLSQDSPPAPETQFVPDSLLGLGEGEALEMLPPAATSSTSAAAAAGLPLVQSLLLPVLPQLQLQSSDSFSYPLPLLPLLPLLPSHHQLAPFVNLGSLNTEPLTHHSLINHSSLHSHIRSNAADAEFMTDEEILQASGIFGNY